MLLNTNVLTSLRKRDFIFIIIILLLIAGLYFMSSRPKEKQLIKVPYQVEIIVPGKKGVSDTIYQPKPYPVYQKNPVNDSLLNLYLSAEDSIGRLNLHIKAIAEKTYTETYTDSLQQIKVFTKVRGDMLEQQTSYHVFPSSVEATGTTEIEVPKRNMLFWKLSLGNKIRSEFILDPLIQGEFILKNKKDELFSLEGNTRGDVLLGYGRSF
jgi:hypothetical protein